MARKRRIWGVSPEQIVEAWETSNSVDEAAKKVGMDKPILLARVSKYRKSGVKLKSMRRATHGKPLDVRSLNDLVQQIRSTQDEPGEEHLNFKDPEPTPTDEVKRRMKDAVNKTAEQARHRKGK